MNTLLVVDDEAGIAEALAETLSEEGYRVLTAPNGKVGFELAQREKPALIMLDFMMPVEDGSSMLRRVRAVTELAHVPVIMMSSVAEATVRREAPSLNAFLRKPFKLQTVLDLVSRLLSEERAAS